MIYEDQLKNFIERLKSIKDTILTEEATKTAIIMPFFQLLGYDVFNPTEFIPEYTADVGIKKGEKVDYAISLNGEVAILIEAKSVTEDLNKHDSQLFRYYSTTSAKFGILTNGIIYRFYTDLESENLMDKTPFFEIDLLNIADNEIQELKKFEKSVFDVSKIMDTASGLKYVSAIKKVLKDLFTSPSDDFIRLILNQNVYDGQKNQNVIDKYRPLVKKSIAQYINDLVNDKIQNALYSDDDLKNDTSDEPIEENSSTDGIITTEDELKSYYIICSIIGSDVPLERVSYKDTLSYFGILIDNKVTKWLCRVCLKENTRYIIIADESKKEVKYTIENLEDIYKYSKELKARLKYLLQ